MHPEQRLRRATWLCGGTGHRCEFDRIEGNPMSKSKDSKRDQKKAPQKTAKQKKQANRDKQSKSSSVLPNTGGS
jgi:hypothetical protein